MVPQWLSLAVAVLVALFGLHRIRISMRSQSAEESAVSRGGLYGMKRRTHRIIGVFYLVLAAGLIATSFGWSPLGGLLAPETQTDPVPAPGLLAPSAN